MRLRGEKKNLNLKKKKKGNESSSVLFRDVPKPSLNARFLNKKVKGESVNGKNQRAPTRSPIRLVNFLRS